MKSFPMDRKRRWNNLYPEKKSSIMISLPTPVTSTKDDSLFNIKTWNTFFGIKHVRVALIFLLTLFVLVSLYLSFSSNTDEHQMLSKRAHCPKVLSRPRDFVAVQPYEVELISQVISSIAFKIFLAYQILPYLVKSVALF